MNRISLFPFIAFLLFAVAVLICGCNSQKFSVAPVSGVLTINGQPAPNWGVSFQPVSTGALNIGPGAAAVTDAEGRFVLRTVEDSARRGATPGKNTVTFCWMESPYYDSTTPSTAPFSLPAESVNGSLIFDVPADGTEEANFSFVGKPRK